MFCSAAVGCNTSLAATLYFLPVTAARQYFLDGNTLLSAALQHFINSSTVYHIPSC